MNNLEWNRRRRHNQWPTLWHAMTPLHRRISIVHIIKRDIFISRTGQAFVCLRKSCWVPEGRQRDIEKARRCTWHWGTRHHHAAAAALPLLPAIIALNTIFYFVHAPLDLTSCSLLVIEKPPTKTRQLENQVFLFYFYFEFSTDLRLIILVNLS